LRYDDDSFMYLMDHCNPFPLSIPLERRRWVYHIRFIPTCIHTRPSYLPA